MKKVLAFLLAMTMLLCLCACGDDTGKKDDNTDKGGSTTAAATEGEGTTTATEGDATTTTTEGAPSESEAPSATESEGATSATETEATAGTSTNAQASSTGATKEPTKAPTTSATKAPTTTTPTTQPTQPEQPDDPVDTRPTIKILSIGHSFSRDAMDTYMADLFKAAGYNATFGYLYYPGASLERQYHYVKDNSTSYEMYNKCVDGTWYRNGSANAEQALADEDWDIVTFQPSPDYGKGTMTYTCQWGCNRQVNDYDHFDQLVKLVKDKLAAFGNEDVQFYWHLTWSFATDCKLWSFTYSNYNQNTMYWDFIKATGTYVTINPNIKGTIPCNTAIQNIRSSWMGDTFNEPGNYDPNGDGYHLNDKGDLVAAMTWVAYFTGKSATEFKIETKYSDAQYAAFAEAVDNAIKKPLTITKSTYTTEP